MSNVYPFRRGRDADAAERDLELDAEAIKAGYTMLFEPGMRSAQLACLGFAQLVREDRWPDVEMVCAFAQLYRVSPAELGAFFGLLSYRRGGRKVWVDAMRGPIPHYAAVPYLSDAQRKAFGFLGLTADVLRAEERAAGV